MPIHTSKLSGITVAILAGGRGTRLAAALPGRQKVVVHIGENPFLKYILDQLNKAGFRNVIMCTGYLGNQVREEFGDTYKFLSLQYSQELFPLGAAGALRLALPYFVSHDILALNGDTFCNIDFQKLWQFHIHKKSRATIVLSRVPDTSRFGTVQLDKDDRIIRFQEKKSGIGSGLVNAGIYLISRSLIDTIPEGKIISLEKELFPKWVRNRFYGYQVNKDFIDIGTPESYEFAQKFFVKFKL
jgi:D-glycero-alpha-D-manno-heptose 1-phosphate guanylyltransferase